MHVCYMCVVHNTNSSHMALILPRLEIFGFPQLKPVLSLLSTNSPWSVFLLLHLPPTLPCCIFINLLKTFSFYSKVYARVTFVFTHAVVSAFRQSCGQINCHRISAVVTDPQVQDWPTEATLVTIRSSTLLLKTYRNLRRLLSEEQLVFPLHYLY